MPRPGRLETVRKHLIEFFRNPLNKANTNASIARSHGVTAVFVRKIRAEVEAEGAAYTKGSLKKLAVVQLRLDGGTQPRAQLDLSLARQYRDDLKAGASFPAIGVVYDGTDYWVWDGFHRAEAFRMAGRETILAEVRQGTRRDAVLLSAGANGEHGLRRTNDDKRRAVETLLLDEEWRQWSDHEIARRCGVDHKTVAALRKELQATREIPQSNDRKGGDGRTINTANIGHKPSTNGTHSTASAAASPTAVEPLSSPPMVDPVVVDHRVAITLNGVAEIDLDRLLHDYPRVELRKLCRLLMDELESGSKAEAVEKGTIRPLSAQDRAILARLGSSPQYRAILKRLRRGPVVARELATIAPKYTGRISEMRHAGFKINNSGQGAGSTYELVEE